MNKTTKILFPTDFSAPASNAFKYALALAEKMNATIEVLHVVVPVGESLDFQVIVSQVTAELLEVNRKQLKSFIAKGTKVVFKENEMVPGIAMNLEVGAPAKTIVEIAKRDDIDLIIMGTRGENRSRIEKFLGSVAQSIVKKSHCPVIVIPENAKFENLTTIVYASEILESDPFEIWNSVKLLKGFNPVIQCVHFDYRKKGDLIAWTKMGEMKAFFENNNPGMQINFHHLPGTKLEDDLNGFVEKYDADLLVMYQPKHKLWEHIFQKSATNRMSIHTDIPLLILKR